MRKLLAILLLLVTLGFGLVSCRSPLEPKNEAGPRAVAAVGAIVWEGESDKDVAASIVAIPSARTNASGDMIASNAHNADFPGIYFIWDSKQKDNGYLKVSASMFDEYESFVLTSKEANTYWDFVIKLQDGQEQTEDGSYVFFIPKANGNKNINMVFIGEFKVLPPTIIGSDNLLLTVGMTKKLEVAGGNASVTWTSSNPDIVRVDQNGKITAIGLGAAALGDVSLYVTYSDPAVTMTRFEEPVVPSAPGSQQYRLTNPPLKDTATITAKRGDIEVSITVTTTLATSGNMNSLPSLKDQFAPYFLIGNVNSAGLTSAGLQRHFNIITYENNMKPSYVSGSLNTTTGILSITSGATLATNVASVINAGYKLHGHTLFWHDQNASWASEANLRAVYNNAGGGAAGTAAVVNVMTQYAQQYPGRDGIKGRVYSWDVLNEVMHDDGFSTGSPYTSPAAAQAATWQQSVRQGIIETSWWGLNGNPIPDGFVYSLLPSGSQQVANPWIRVIGPEDGIYYMFLTVRKADPNALLYINDYGTELPGKRQKYANLITYINNRYAASQDKLDMIALGEAPDRKLIDGMGMQGHQSFSHLIEDIRAEFDLYRTLGVKLAITELDMEANTSRQRPSAAATSTVSNYAILRQADYHYQYFKIMLENSDILDRVTWWGYNNSWRAGTVPLPWLTAAWTGAGVVPSQQYDAKPAYWSMMRALEEYEEERGIR